MNLRTTTTTTTTMAPEMMMMMGGAEASVTVEAMTEMPAMMR